MKCEVCNKDATEQLRSHPLCAEHHREISDKMSACVTDDEDDLCDHLIRKAKRPKLDPTVKSNEIHVDMWDGIINEVIFGSGIPRSVVLKIIETDTNGLQDSIDEDRILDNDGDDCFVREYQDEEKKVTLEEAVEDLLSCTELNLDEMEPTTVAAMEKVRLALADLKNKH